MTASCALCLAAPVPCTRHSTPRPAVEGEDASFVTSWSMKLAGNSGCISPRPGLRAAEAVGGVWVCTGGREGGKVSMVGRPLLCRRAGMQEGRDLPAGIGCCESPCLSLGMPALSGDPASGDPASGGESASDGTCSRQHSWAIQ